MFKVEFKSPLFTAMAFCFVLFYIWIFFFFLSPPFLTLYSFLINKEWAELLIYEVPSVWQPLCWILQASSCWILSDNVSMYCYSHSNMKKLKSANPPYNRARSWKQISHCLSSMILFFSKGKSDECPFGYKLRNLARIFFQMWIFKKSHFTWHFTLSSTLASLNLD